MFRNKTKPTAPGFDRAARDALKPTPTWVATHTGLNRAAFRAKMRAARLARPSASPAPAPPSRREIVRLRSVTVRTLEDQAVSRG